MFTRVSSVNPMPRPNKIITFPQTFQQNGPFLLIQIWSKYVFHSQWFRKANWRENVVRSNIELKVSTLKQEEPASSQSPVPLPALSRPYLFACSASISLVIKNRHCKLLHYGFDTSSDHSRGTGKHVSFVICNSLSTVRDVPLSRKHPAFLIPHDKKVAC